MLGNEGPEFVLLLERFFLKRLKPSLLIPSVDALGHALGSLFRALLGGLIVSRARLPGSADCDQPYAAATPASRGLCTSASHCGRGCCTGSSASAS